MEEEWPEDPSLDWPSRFAARDPIRLASGELGVVDMVLDYSPDETPRWELIVTILTRRGYIDTLVAQPWGCRKVTDDESIQQIRAAGIE